MTIRDALEKITTVAIAPGSPPVYAVAAGLLAEATGAAIREIDGVVGAGIREIDGVIRAGIREIDGVVGAGIREIDGVIRAGIREADEATGAGIPESGGDAAFPIAAGDLEPGVFMIAPEFIAPASGAGRDRAESGGAAAGAGRSGTEGDRPAAGVDGKGIEGYRPAAAGSGTGDEGVVPGVFLQLTPEGGGGVRPTHDRYLYSFLRALLSGLGSRKLSDASGASGAAEVAGEFFPVAFAWQRSVYDFFLTQEGRIQKDLDRGAYLERLAGIGATHVEVNALAAPMGREPGVPGEIYPMFYTYCPALDQFVSSSLNEGLYPREWLDANLARLKENARLAIGYGLVPGLLCFEPRSVPEEFFDRWPMLRGARVDHPFRSFKPRYNLTVTHPLVRSHYTEMVQRLLSEVPELGYLSVWTNDSGAGFEYTKSLYVGRNGGAYLIREWKDDAEIARAAGENVVTFLHTLRDAGRELNPEFRVLTRMESFSGEHDTVWSGLEEGLEVEAASLTARGWAMPYAHPRYPDISDINGGSIYQAGFDPGEGEKLDELADRDSAAHFYFAAGPNSMFAPLIGVPYPTLVYNRLKLLHDGGVSRLAHIGGVSPPGLVPFNPNHEVVRAFQFDPDLDIETEVLDLAVRWAGAELAADLRQAWGLTEEAILAYPNVTSLYATFGFTWYRLWLRPFVPDIEAIPEAERAYYQDHMCTTPHNPNNIDLSRDVLFRLASPDHCRRCVERIDAHLAEPLARAIGSLAGVRERARELLGAENVIEDQLVRLSALRCWFETQRNVAAWIAGVYGYLAAEEAGDGPESGRAGGRTGDSGVDASVSGTAGEESVAGTASDGCRPMSREESRALLAEMIEREIANTRRLQTLLDSGVEFMATTDLGETPLMHGRNLHELLEKRVALMQAHAGDAPRLDHDYLMRRAGEPLPGGWPEPASS